MLICSNPSPFADLPFAWPQFTVVVTSFAWVVMPFTHLSCYHWMNRFKPGALLQRSLFRRSRAHILEALPCKQTGIAEMQYRCVLDKSYAWHPDTPVSTASLCHCSLPRCSQSCPSSTCCFFLFLYYMAVPWLIHIPVAKDRCMQYILVMSLKNKRNKYGRQ